MNKKGKLSLQGIVTASFLMAVLYFIFWSSFGLGGGLAAVYSIGALAARIPAWIWIIFAILYILMKAK